MDNHLPPFRTVPLSRSWDNGSKDSRSTTASRQESSREEPRLTMQRTFQNTIEAAEDFLKSPALNSGPRLGITPPTVSTVASSSTPGSPPRYMTYRSSLAGRTPFRDANDDDTTPSPQKPLDPVILSFDRKEAEGESSDDELAPTVFPPNLYANLQQRAYRYRLEDDALPTGGNASHASAQNSSEIDCSAITEPTSNMASLREFPASPIQPDGDSSDEENQTARGPGGLYLQVLKTDKTLAHVPTPPRRYNFNANHPNKILEESEEDTESDVSATFEAPHPAQSSRNGEVSFADIESETGSDLPPTAEQAATKSPNEHLQPSRRPHCGRFFICLAIGLLVSLVLVIFLVDNDWQPRFMRNESENRPIAPLSRQPSPAPSVRVSTQAPSVHSSSSDTNEFPTVATLQAPSETNSSDFSTTAPSLDPTKVSRVKEALEILSDWGRFELWEDSETPQFKALQWWIGNSGWDSYSDTRKIQRYVLAVLYHATEGESWNDHTNWLTNEHECFWFTSSVGSVCNGKTQSLEVLHLEQNQMRGMLPAEIALLTDLVEIRFISNQIFGSIPGEWAGLPNLRVLELRDNMLAGGSIPDGLSALKQLETLDLSDNRLGGRLPEFVGELPQLVFLMLGGNGYSGPIPSSWSSLGQLRVLSVERNRLTGGIPLSFAQGLQQLRELRVGTNFLNQVSSLYLQFDLLEHLDMSENKLNGTIPDVLYLMDSLTTLNLEGNMIFGELSENIGNLALLVNLNLAHNLLGGNVPESIGTMRDLRRLQLQDNVFSGDFPVNLRQLRRIELLRLDNNRFSRVENTCRGAENALFEFYADCAPETGLRCTCCTHCCSQEHGICSEAGAL